MMLELAIGDAYGAGFEYAPESQIKRENNLQKYVQHQKHKTLKPGSYTDDTQMSIGIAELLIEDIEWSPFNIANKFLEVFKRDERQGYAQGFYQFLKEIKSGEEFLKRIRPYSEKNGAAMRSVPLGYLSSPEKVMEYAGIQASLTHNTSLGINSSKAVGLMAYYFIHDVGTKDQLSNYIENYLGKLWVQPWIYNVKSRADIVVRSAIYLIENENKLSDLLIRCVNLGGDVDTVATIALGVASCSKEYQNDLPHNLIDNLENGKYGRDYLIQLNKKLLERFKK